MNKFNLTFSGEIQSGLEPEWVKLRFAKMFSIDDPERLERFFTGQPVILRRNLERKEAAELFQDLRDVGVVAELVKVTATDASVVTARASKPARPPAIAARPAEPKSSVSNNNRKLSTAAATAKLLAEETRLTAQEQDRTNATQAQTEQDQAQRATQQKARAQAEQLKTAAAAAALEKELEEKARREEAVAVREKEEANRQETARRQEEVARRLEVERKAAELQAQLEIEEHRVAQESARREAARLEKKRLAAEKAAKRKAEREAQMRLEAKEAAKREAAEAAAKRKAEREAQIRLEAKEAAKREAAAKRKAELEIQRRREAAEEAKLKAQMDAANRKEAAEAQRLQVELDEIERQEAAAEARLRAQLKEKERQAAIEAARVKAEADARLQAELAEKEKLAAAEAGRIKAQAQQRKDTAERESAERRREVAQEQAALQAKQRNNKARQESNQLELLLPNTNNAVDSEHQDLSRHEPQPAAPPTSPPEPPISTPVPPDVTPITAPGAGKPGRARVKTTLDVPLRSTAGNPKDAPAAPRKRQPGEPNLYQLQAFRNNQEIRGRAVAARQKMRRAITLGSCAVLALLIAGTLFLQLEQPATIDAPHAIAIDSQSRPVVVAGDWLLLHDRAGNSTEKWPLRDFGVATLGAPMLFAANGELLAPGTLREKPIAPATTESAQLLRCNFEKHTCVPFAAATALTRIAAFTINPIDSTVLVLDSRASELRKLSSDGELLASAAVTLPPSPTLRLHSGLLFMNSAAGAAISVFRYDTAAFGQQLDEVLLRPAPAIAAQQTRSGDFIWSGNSWWVSLYHQETGDVGLYRFDAQWNYLGQVSLEDGNKAMQLASWGDKTLVNNHSGLALMRFNAQGQAETPMISQQLTELVAEQQRRRDITTLGWRSALFVFLLAACSGLLVAWIQGLRALVYQPQRERGAPPVDDLASELQWVDQVPKRSALLRRRSISYTIFVLALVLLAIGSNISAMQLSALLIAVSGPAILLMLLAQQEAGSIAVMRDHLLLVDHRGIYHMGSGSDIQYRGSFLLLDDIVVFTGNRMVPTFVPEQVASLIRPLASGGVKVDRNTLLVKLLESRHPFARGAIAIIIAIAIAVALLGVTQLL